MLAASFHQALISEKCESSTSSDFWKFGRTTVCWEDWRGEWYDLVTMMPGYWLYSDVRVILNDCHLILLPWWLDNDTQWWLNSHKKLIWQLVQCGRDSDYKMYLATDWQDDDSVCWIDMIVTTVDKLFWAAVGISRWLIDYKWKWLQDESCTLRFGYLNLS